VIGSSDAESLTIAGRLVSYYHIETERRARCTASRIALADLACWPPCLHSHGARVREFVATKEYTGPFTGLDQMLELLP
jgi:hypothetical protein